MEDIHDIVRRAVMFKAPCAVHGDRRRVVLAWNRDLGKQERHVPTVLNNLCADLDELVAQRGQGLVLDLLRERQGVQEVAEIIIPHAQGVGPVNPATNRALVAA